jgi:hypothetical protein
MKRQPSTASTPSYGAQPWLAQLAGRALVGLILVLALLASCTGCAPAPGTPTAIVGSGTDISIITDPDTGCQYLGVYGTAVTKRMAADGFSQMGCRGIAR